MRVRVFLMQLFDGIDGVRGRLALQFAIIYLELRFAFDRAAQHLHTDFRRRYRSVFVRGKAGRNKNNSFERKSFQSDARQNQVGVVHRIESAAVNADLLQFNNSFVAKRGYAPRANRGRFDLSLMRRAYS